MIYIVEEVVHHGMEWYYSKYVSKVSAVDFTKQKTELTLDLNSKANATNGTNGEEGSNSKECGEHKEHEGMIVDLVATQKENAFQVSPRRIDITIEEGQSRKSMGTRKEVTGH